MACVLTDGCEYGLSSQDSDCDGVSLIFVKLTDSALKAIDECIKFQISRNSPLIQFLPDGSEEGHIQIPRHDGQFHSFKFSMGSNNDIEGPQGSFQCLQHTKSRSLQTVGHLPYKMRIQANEDVYEATRQRVQVAEEESKKNCTRVIKTSPYTSRKPKPKTLEPSRPEIQPRPKVPPPPRQNKEVVKKPIRDRILHLLALRPYKKPELITRLYKDGIKDKEKNGISTILQQVAYMRENSYNLHRHSWLEIKDDWPFYTDQDRNLLKSRRPSNLTPPGPGGGAHSPNNAVVLKRTSLEPASNMPKKQRISHFKRPEQPTQKLSPIRGIVRNGAMSNGDVNGLISEKSCSPINNGDSTGPWNGKDRPKGSDTPDDFSTPESSPDGHEDSPPHKPDYLTEYSPIDCVEKRSTYKAHFNSLYDEYRELFKVVDKVCRHFASLNERLGGLEPHTPEHSHLVGLIKEDYKNKKKDREYMDARKKFQYLHDKLSHIKRLVLDYDKENPVL